VPAKSEHTDWGDQEGIVRTREAKLKREGRVRRRHTKIGGAGPAEKGSWVWKAPRGNYYARKKKGEKKKLWGGRKEGRCPLKKDT